MKAYGRMEHHHMGRYLYYGNPRKGREKEREVVLKYKGWNECRGTCGFFFLLLLWFTQGICLVVGLLGDMVVLFLDFKESPYCSL